MLQMQLNFNICPEISNRDYNYILLLLLMQSLNY